MCIYSSRSLQVPQVDIERLEPRLIEEHQTRAVLPVRKGQSPDKEMYDFDPNEGLSFFFLFFPDLFGGFSMSSPEYPM